MMKKLIISFSLMLMLSLFCNPVKAINKGDIGYINEATWWTLSLRMLDVVEVAIKSGDKIYLQYLHHKGCFYIQKVRIKIVVERKIENKIQVRVFGSFLTFWIWESFIENG